MRYQRKSESRHAGKQLLYNYREDRRRLNELQADYIHGRSGPEAGRRGSTPGDPTGRAGAGLAGDEEAARLERRCGAVERTLERLKKEHDPYIARRLLELVERVYFRRDLSLTGYSIQVDRAEKTVRRWNKIILGKLAEESRGLPE